MEFYIGVENASDIKANSKEEFLHHLSDMICEAESKGEEQFSITVEN